MIWRPTTLHDQNRDSDDEDYQDRDYDVAALANNLSQAFRYGIYTNDMDEGQGSLDRDDEDVYFDDESAEVVLSSLRLGDDQESSLFTNSNWFALEDNRMNNAHSTSALASASPGGEEADGDEANKDEDELDTATSPAVPETKPELQLIAETSSGDAKPEDDSGETDNKPPEWVEWRETSSSSGVSEADKPLLPNGACEEHSESPADDSKTEPSPADGSITEPSPADGSKTEPSPADDNKAEPSPADDSKAKPSSADDSKSEPSPSDDGKADPSPADDGKTEPSPTDDGKTEPSPAPGESIEQQESTDKRNPSTETSSEAEMQNQD